MNAAPTLQSLSQDLATGRTTSRALVEACLAAIADPQGEGARAFIHVDRDRAIAQADAMDRLRAGGAALSPFAGIPISIKDLFDVAGQVTRAGSIVLADQPAAATDAASVARLRRAGFVFVGRTNMSEFAFSGLGLNPHYDTPRNPWERDAGRVPGGSSSGAAISVAEGMAHAALGTDTGGSCRIPAAFMGLVGYKPTARRVPLDGAVPLSQTLDSIGPIARSVACCSTLDAILADTPRRSPAKLGVRGLRFAVPANYAIEAMDTIVTSVFERALSRLSAAGAQIDRIAFPEFDDIPSINAKGGFTAAESYAWHGDLLQRRGPDYDPRVRTRIERGAGQSAADYIKLTADRRRFITAVEQRLASFDGLLMPTVPIIPPRIADLEADAAFSATNLLVLRNPTIVNLFDGCAISLPVHDGGQAPVGLMIAARAEEDTRLFGIAEAVEELFAPQRTGM